ncbi:sulfatase family protein [Puniceicoccus vermicola]|uniref:Sulfatase-like hydrolase/transferase n=1 Tax=Puniceicoccus vermicola TaxID=388746 RepID=A0A7X1B3R3_9BACT|nr:sulfatase-like hydrolase/transferase [Puniceicoccus vermicola]MBC2603973.1 sulfatase-like hydrolase/transferase [Puniceicoccus vermicola]
MDKKRPNILFITCDQLRKDALGCYGNELIKTPNIDSIANAGIKFENTFVTSPACAPSRGSMLTGRMPSVHGLRINGVSLPKEEVSFIEVLRNAGYQTAGVGKMHFNPQWNFPPDNVDDLVTKPDTTKAISPQPQPWEFPFYGMDHCMLVEDHNAGPYGEYLLQHGFDPWKDPHSFTYPQSYCGKSSIPLEHSKSNWITDRALEFLDQTADESPFFVWISYVHPHHPFVAPESYDTMYEAEDMPLPVMSKAEREQWPFGYDRKWRAEEGSHESVGLHKFDECDWQRIKAHYYGMISHIDDQIGRILDRLRADGEFENTYIFFLADHGELLGDHGLLFKGAHYESVLNIPLLIQGPGISDSSESDSYLSMMDISATLLGFVDLPLPDGMMGCDLSDPISGDRPIPSRERVLVEDPFGPRTLLTPEYRITWHGYGEKGELYDRKADPENFVNLWSDASSADLKSEALDALVHELVLTVDPLPHRTTLC